MFFCSSHAWPVQISLYLVTSVMGSTEKAGKRTLLTFPSTCAGAMLIARWILNEEDIDEHNTYLELDNIAQMVQNTLRGNNGSTNTTSTIPLEGRMARSNEEFAAVTHPTACLRILDCLKHVLYQQLQFKGNVNEYYRKENSMLHQVTFY